MRIELAPQGAGDRAARGRSCRRRAGRRSSRIGPRASRLQRSHGEELEDPVLHLLQVVVVLVEHRARVREVEVVLGGGVPRQRGDPVEVRADDAVLGHAGCRRSQPGELAVGLLAHLLGQVGLVELLAQLVRPPAWVSSVSPSSSWMAFSCWRRKYSRWLFSISDWTWAWILEPSSSTSSSRFSNSVRRRSRLETSISSSSSCFSSVFSRSAPAIRCRGRSDPRRWPP